MDDDHKAVLEEKDETKIKGSKGIYFLRCFR